MPPQTLSSAEETRLALPIFLKMLTGGGLAMDKAMAIASKMYAIISLGVQYDRMKCFDCYMQDKIQDLQHSGSTWTAHRWHAFCPTC